MRVYRISAVLALSSITALVATAAEPASRAAARTGTSRQIKTRLAANVRKASTDWPQFLGPARDNHSPDTGLLSQWPEGGPQLVKTIEGLGIGFSNMAIVDGTLYTMGNRGEREYVMAFNLDSGEKVWEFDNASAYHNGYGDGPRSTPTVDGDLLYALGGQGDLVCLERKSGTKVWQKNIVKEFHSGVPGWGICESVLIDGEKLICTPGGKDATMVALDKKTGSTIWTAAVPENDRPAYASPIEIQVGPVRQFVQFTARGTIGVRAADGKFLWRDDSSANGTANCCAPAAEGNMVVTSSGYGKGATMVELTSSGDQTTAKFEWHTNDLKIHHGGMVLLDGHIYGSNEGVLTCLELKTGAVKWQNRSVGKGSVTYADGKVVLRSEAGPVALLEASPAEYKELGRFDQPQRSKARAWTYPVVIGGKLYLRDQDILLVYSIK